MNVLEMIRNGGIGAMAAVAAGLVGVVVGAIGFAVKGKSAVGLGVFTLLLGTLAAGLGMGGTLWGKHQTDEAIAMVNPVDRDVIRQAGYGEAQDASWVGFGASLLPLLFGLGHVLRARASAAGPVVASLTQPREESVAPVAGAALAFAAIGALAAGGAFVMARQPLPPTQFALDDDDARELARAIEEMKTNPDNACLRLDAALLKYCTASTAWPRQFAKQPPASLDWRPAAAECIDRFIHPPARPDGLGATLLIEAWLESPLVYDARLRGLILSRAREPNGAAAPVEPAPAPVAPEKESTGHLAPAEVAKVVRAANPKFRACYEQSLKKNAKIAGKVTMRFVIGPTGSVTSVDDQSNPPFDDPAVPACLMAQFRKLKFPKPSGGPVTVTYPFVFSAAR